MVRSVYRQDPDNPTPVLVAVFCWGGASKRLKLVVQLRGSVIIGEHREPNLTIQCVGLALRKLQDQWKLRHGYRPLPAESFHDPQHHTGTLYKATNWTLLGSTKGYLKDDEQA